MNSEMKTGNVISASTFAITITHLYNTFNRISSFHIRMILTGAKCPYFSISHPRILPIHRYPGYIYLDWLHNQMVLIIILLLHIVLSTFLIHLRKFNRIIQCICLSSSTYEIFNERCLFFFFPFHVTVSSKSLVQTKTPIQAVRIHFLKPSTNIVYFLFIFHLIVISHENRCNYF